MGEGIVALLICNPNINVSSNPSYYRLIVSQGTSSDDAVANNVRRASVVPLAAPKVCPNTSPSLDNFL